MTDSSGSRGLPEPRVLGWLLAAHNVLQVLPTGRRLGEFVAAALKDIPGVCRGGLCFSDVSLQPCLRSCSALEQGYSAEPAGGCPGGRLHRFALDTSVGHYGQLVLEVDDKERFEPYEPFVANFAGSLALLLETRSQRRQLERLLDDQKSLLDRLQEALLDIPRELPGVRFGHLYRSATREAQVGGDFYDVFPVRSGRIGLLIGDVCGHGIEAARVATMVKDTVRAFAHQFRQPHRVLRETNRLLVEKNLLGFVTAHLGFLDPEEGTLRYSSAGHPPPLFQARGRTRLLESNNVPLGVFPTAGYRDSNLRVPAGSLLLFYTDGVTEARSDGVMFGEEGLLAAFTRHAGEQVEVLPSLVLAEALRFSQGQLNDDAAVLAVNYVGRTALG